MNFMLVGRVIDLRPEPTKAFIPICSTLSGMLIDVKGHRSKAYCDEGDTAARSIRQLKARVVGHMERGMEGRGHATLAAVPILYP